MDTTINFGKVFGTTSNAPVAGPMHTAKMLEQILTELQKLNTNLAPKKAKVETR